MKLLGTITGLAIGLMLRFAVFSGMVYLALIFLNYMEVL